MLGLCCLFPANKTRKWPFFNLQLNCIILGSVDTPFHIPWYQVSPYWGWDGHLPFTSATAFIFSKKLAFIWGGMLTLIPHFIPWFVLENTTNCRETTSRIWLLLLHLAPSHNHEKGKEAICHTHTQWLCHAAVSCRITMLWNSPCIPPPFYEAIIASLMLRGKRPSSQHR